MTRKRSRRIDHTLVSTKNQFHRRIFSKMDKMTNNEFYNRINSKFLYLFEVKFPHLSLKMNFSSR